ncbi:hypothetical protein [Kineococcus terrestris]|uniref:hypothetical protein n=1 Tax=Kineococcus terrestris TaxID=2044856 RepID=UPI0034DADAA1
MPSPFEQAVLRRPTAPAPAPVQTGRVTRSDSTGVWITTAGQSEAHPSGPCRGGHRPALATVDGTPRLQREQLPVGVTVAFVSTTTGPWILAWEG